MTFLEGKKGLCRKLDIDLDTIDTDDMFSIDDLNDYVNEASIKAWDFCYWDFAEIAKTVALEAGDVTLGYVAYPYDVASMSINDLRLDGKEYKKYNYRDFKRALEINSALTDKVWAEFDRKIFINPNCMAAGLTLDLYGKEVFTRMTSDSELMPFSSDYSTEMMSGNQAIVLLAYAEALSSEKKRNPNQAMIEEKKAYTLLESLRQQFGKGRATEQSANRPFFNVPDYFSTGGPSGSTLNGMF